MLLSQASTKGIRYQRGEKRFIIYTDGSATAGTLNGGAGMEVTEGDPTNPTTLLTKQQRGAAITSSSDRESGRAIGARAALAITRCRGHLH